MPCGRCAEVHVKLVGEDGKRIAIMARVSTALRRAGVSEQEVKAYCKEATAGDYDHGAGGCADVH
jgi:hypothetical protein